MKRRSKSQEDPKTGEEERPSRPPDLQTVLGNQEMLARIKQRSGELKAIVPRSGLPHRRQMEKAFGLDLGDVEVIRGVPEIQELLGASAVTDGDTIVFASSSPSPEEVAHEVAHLQQERQMGSGGGGAVAPPSGASEMEAQMAAKAVVAGEAPVLEEKREGSLSRNPAAVALPLAGGVSMAPILAGIGLVALVGLVAYGGYVLMSKATGNQTDSGLRDLSDEEISRRARDSTLSGEERRRYQKEEKARGLRNKRKRNSN